ncbi:MAG: T9SS type A sorting domain-containing protein [Bacteroidetes bacterium]|nr:T9SS type A sorting domain-containing protein [Bacteroidota bacterium]
MKKILLLSFAFAALMVGQFSTATAQVCVVDNQYSSPGIYPSDTLADMTANAAYNEVVQFVFPVDTVLFGFTLAFDSFLVSQVTQIPNGLNYECNQNHPTCNYVSNPPNLTRGCVKIYGTPTAQSPAYPGYDSIIVTGVAYVTVPFVGVQSIPQDIPVYYRIGGVVANTSPFANAGLNIAPNPVAGQANVRYNLVSDANVKISVMDLMGREIAVLSNGMQRQGEQELVIDSKDLATGAYLLKMSINDGEYVATKKFTAVH